MSEDRRRILSMLAEGRISVDDAERLLAALGSPSPRPGEPAVALPPAGARKYLRVIVDAFDSGASKPTNVNVRIPLQLLRAGVRLTSLLPPEARAQVDSALSAKGFDLDLGRLKPENLDALIEALGDTTVEIDAADERAKVRVFCE